MKPLKPDFSGLSANTFRLAFASLFADVSTEMLYPVLPIYLTETLRASPRVLGLVEGLAQAVQYIAQGLSGWLSDRIRRRKPIALLGYFLAAVSKPLIGLSTSWTGVLGARTLDRLASGTRSAPRDALVAASVEEDRRGKAFGLEGAGDNLGACLGPLLAIALLSLLHASLRSIFFLAVIPGLLAFLMVLFVGEREAVGTAKLKLDLNIRRFPKGYVNYLLSSGLFGIGNLSNSFLILRTKDLGASLTMAVFIYALFNLVAALASYPAGHLSDAFGRKRVILLSFVLILLAFAGFALATNVFVVGALFVLHGLSQGIFRSVGKAFAADFLPAELHASGVGWFAATAGLSGLVAGLVGGELWVRIGPPATFLYGAAFALMGSLALLLLVPERSVARKGLPSG
jgi:MFS family permease